MFEKIKKGNTLAAAVAVLTIVIIGLAIIMYKSNEKYVQTSENSYNSAFYQLTEYVENVETYLAKSLISTTPEHGAETLTNLWREANLAQTYLSMLPIESQELENTEKFLNQVSDYSYALSRKNIYNESLSQDDLNNLKSLHQYSVDLKNTLFQLSDDLNAGRFEWKNLTQEEPIAFSQQVSNMQDDQFTQMEEDFHEFSGLIYDGAFSDHLTNRERKGLTGDDIDEETAKQKAEEFLKAGDDNLQVKNITSQGISDNANIPVYDFSVEIENQSNVNIGVSRKGGHIVYMNSDREVNSEVISQEDANEKGKEYLRTKGFDNMKETYFLKQQGVVTVNYAYTQDGVVMYPDLIKVKIALDDGEVLGIETTGYLNNHTERDTSKVAITKEEAKKTLNKDLQIESEGLAYIPTEWETEVLCYEFKGKVEDREFLVYINAENGREEDILIITDTPNGTLTM